MKQKFNKNKHLLIIKVLQNKTQYNFIKKSFNKLTDTQTHIY